MGSGREGSLDPERWPPPPRGMWSRYSHFFHTFSLFFFPSGAFGWVKGWVVRVGRPGHPPPLLAASPATLHHHGPSWIDPNSCYMQFSQFERGGAAGVVSSAVAGVHSGRWPV